MIEAALDTSSGTTLAIRTDAGVVQDSLPLMGRDNDRQLATWIVDRLRAADCRPRDVQRWTVGTGPGSFTGIRVGIAFVKGVCTSSGALYRGLPSSLALAAAAADRAATANRIGVLHDARRGQLILSLYRREQNELQAEGTPQVHTPEQLAAMADQCQAWVTAHAEVARALLPDAMCGALLDVEQIDARKLLTQPSWGWPETARDADASTEPVYVRPAVFIAPTAPREVRQD